MSLNGDDSAKQFGFGFLRFVLYSLAIYGLLSLVSNHGDKVVGALKNISDDAKKAGKKKLQERVDKILDRIQKEGLTDELKAQLDAFLRENPNFDLK